MSYILILLTGIIAIVATLTKTHKEVEENGMRYQKLTKFGFIAVILISIFTIASLIKEYKDKKDAEIKALFQLPDK